MCALLAVGACGGRPCSGAPVAWRTVAPGLRYASTEDHGTLYHLVRVDLGVLDLAVADARRPGRKVEEVSRLVVEAGAVAGINGTFFDGFQRPLGLVVANGAELNPLHDTGWFAGLVVRTGPEGARAQVLTTDGLKALSPADRSALSVALQVGPRTVADGQPLKLKKQVAARSAVGLVSPTDLVLLATENGPVESNDLASFMARAPTAGGLGCTSGLMLDGGPSTQLSVRTEAFSLDVRGGYGVPNALVVRAR